MASSNSAPPSQRRTITAMKHYFGSRILSVPANLPAPFVAMDGGKFWLPDNRHDEVIDFLTELQAGPDRNGGAPQRNLSLVPVLAEETIFFADVDKVPAGFQLKKLLSIIAECINLAAKRALIASSAEIFVFKRVNAEKYHFYCPKATFDRSTRSAIWSAINTKFGFAVCDINCQTLRYEGFMKWDRSSNSYQPGSFYQPHGDTARYKWRDLYRLCWLKPRIPVISGSSNNQPQRPQVPARPRAPASALLFGLDRFAAPPNDGNLYQPAEEKKAEDDDDAVMEDMETEVEAKAEEPSRSESVEAVVHPEIPKKIQLTIQQKCPEIAHILWKYPITSFQGGTRGDTLSLNLKKGSHCPIAERAHKSNRTYLLYQKKAGILSHRCYDSNCAKKCCKGKTVWVAPMSQCPAIGAKLPGSNDKELADYFKKKHPHVVYEPKEKGAGTWFAYRANVGYWKKVLTAYVTKLCSGSFLRTIIGEYNEVISKHEDDAEQVADLKMELSKIITKLQNNQGLRGFVFLLQDIMTEDEPIEWNSNPYYTVFKNGVLQVNRRDPKNHDFYYFGATRPDEYINNAWCCRHDYEYVPTKSAAELRAIKKQAAWLMKNWISKVMPDADDRKLLLTFMSIVLTAFNYKKMIINSGASGNNAKSSLFEFLIHCLGSYGVIGDKVLLLKKQKDRVSKADLSHKRFCLWEEPDPGANLDVEYLKDLVGGSVQTAGRKNWSNDNVIHLHCKYAINANVMSSMQLQEALMERLLFFLWPSKFTTNPAEVDEANGIYLADPKFKTAAFQEKYKDGLWYLLTEHFKLFEANGYQLKISAAAQHRTIKALKGSDQFLRWFESKYVCLADVGDQKQQFVTLKEIETEFNNMAPAQKTSIIGRQSYAVGKYIKDVISSHTIFKKLYKAKFTNFRLSREDRMDPANRNQIGEGKQYVGHVLHRIYPKSAPDFHLRGFQVIEFDEMQAEVGVRVAGDDVAVQEEWSLYTDLAAMSVEPTEAREQKEDSQAELSEVSQFEAQRNDEQAPDNDAQTASDSNEWMDVSSSFDQFSQSDMAERNEVHDAANAQSKKKRKLRLNAEQESKVRRAYKKRKLNEKAMRGKLD